MSTEELPVGAIVVVGGVKKRHLGGGRFEPVGEDMFKRHDSAECGPIGGRESDHETKPGEV